MKLAVEKNLLLKALSHGQGVVEKRTTVPILSHVLLVASEGALSLTTTDMDIALLETISASVETFGGLCVSSTLIHDVVKKLSDRVAVNLEADFEKGRLFVNSGRSHFELPILNKEEFPVLSQGILPHRFQIAAPVIKYLIDKTRFAMSTEEARYHLNGIFFHTVEHKGEKLLRAVTTDMHRLAYAECSNVGDFLVPDVIMSRKTIQEVIKLLEMAEYPVEIGLSENRVEFAFVSDKMRAALTARLVEGQFPDYSPILTTSYEKTLVVPTRAFAEAVDRVGTVVNDKVRAIKVSLSNNLASLSAISSDFGSANEELDADYNYDDKLEICFNVKYLLDVAAQIQTEEMEIMLTNADSSVLIRPVGDAREAFVLMPMRV